MIAKQKTIKYSVSCTGVGEAFIRTCAAHEVATQFRISKDVISSCESVLEMVEPIGGRGGIIAVDSDGNIAMPFQTMLMYRGAWKDGKITLGIGPELSL